MERAADGLCSDKLGRHEAAVPERCPYPSSSLLSRSFDEFKTETEYLAHGAYARINMYE